MPRHRIIGSRCAAAVLAVLALSLLAPMAGARTKSAALLVGLAAALAAVSAAAMWLRSCFTSRLLAVVAVSTTSLGAVLGLLLGMPGGEPVSPAPVHAVVVATSTAVVLSVVADSWSGPGERGGVALRMLNAHGRRPRAARRGRRPDRRAIGPDTRARRV